MVGIYKITSPSESVYIGQSFNINRRLNAYKYLSCRNQSRIYNSIVKHSWSNHKFEVIHQLPSDIDRDTITRYEQLYIDLYKQCGIDLMNLSDAKSTGRWTETVKQMPRRKTGPKKGSKLRPETINKISASHIGKNKSLEHKQKLRLIPRTTEWKLNMSISKKNFLSKNKHPSIKNREYLSAFVIEYKEGKFPVSVLLKKYGISRKLVNTLLLENNVPKRESKLKNKKVYRFPKPIVQYTIDGQYINRWDSLGDASRATGIRSCQISANAKMQTRCAGGFRWKYDDGSDLKILPEKERDWLNKMIINKPKLCQFDMNGDFIRKWKSGSDVEKELRIPRTNISKATRGIYKHAGGFIWRYSE